MADWYVSSVAYAAVPIWVASTAYSVGQFVRATTTPAQPYQYYVFRCTTAGTSGGSEPAWTGASANNATIVSGGATFTNVTGQSTYGWSAAAGFLHTLMYSSANRLGVAERVFISSDHTETNAASGNQYYCSNSAIANWGLNQIISINRAGSVPPVEADILAGASITTTGGPLVLEAYVNTLWQGISFTYNQSGSSQGIMINSSGQKQHYFKNCAFSLANAVSGSRIFCNNPSKFIWDNTTVNFSHAGQGIQGLSYAVDLVWLNTSLAVKGTVPTTLFLANGSYASCAVAARGVDLSAVTGTLVGTAGSGGYWRLLLDSCKIAAAVTRLAAAATNTYSPEEVELVNCFDGTNYISERNTPAGALSIERSTTLSGGAQDNLGAFSFKLVTSVRSDAYAYPLESFWLDVENTLVGSSKTATVEIISSASLNNNDIRLEVEYLGSTSSGLSSFVDSLPTPLTTTAALTTSTATWLNPPSTPVKQKLSVTFTPQVAGRVRARVKLGKVSATVYVNPQLTIS